MNYNIFKNGFMGMKKEDNEMDKVMTMLIAVFFGSIVFYGAIIVGLYYSYGALINSIK